MKLQNVIFIEEMKSWVEVIFSLVSFETIQNDIIIINNYRLYFKYSQQSVHSTTGIWIEYRNCN